MFPYIPAQVALGAVPLTLSDSSGHVYEPEGLPAAKLARIATIKAERGARVGRYIVASTTAASDDRSGSLART